MVCLYISIVIDDLIIKMAVLGPINNPPHFGDCLKSSPGFSTSYAAVFLLFLFSYAGAWFSIWLIFVELITITVKTFFYKKKKIGYLFLKIRIFHQYRGGQFYHDGWNQGIKIKPPTHRESLTNFIIQYWIKYTKPCE